MSAAGSGQDGRPTERSITMSMSTTTTNDEGVTTVMLGDEDNGVTLTVTPDGDFGTTWFEIEGLGVVAIDDGGIRLDRGQAAELAARLFEQLT